MVRSRVSHSLCKCHPNCLFSNVLVSTYPLPTNLPSAPAGAGKKLYGVGRAGSLNPPKGILFPTTAMTTPPPLGHSGGSSAPGVRYRSLLPSFQAYCSCGLLKTPLLLSGLQKGKRKNAGVQAASESPTNILESPPAGRLPVATMRDVACLCCRSLDD